MVHAALFASLYVLLLALLLLVRRWFRRHPDTALAEVEWLHRRARAIAPVRAFAERHPRVRDFLRARVSPEEYLGLHVTLGALLSLAAVFAFGGIAREAVGRHELARFDVALADRLHRSMGPFSLAAFRVITQFGNPWFVVFLIAAVAFVLRRRGERVLFEAWLLCCVGAQPLNFLLKSIFRRPRPSFTDPFIFAHSYSFPSGHAMGSLVTYGMLAYILLRHARSRAARDVIAAAATLLILLVGLSRLYLGAHFFSDVVAGFAAGTVWLVSCITAVQVALHRALLTPGRNPEGRDEGPLPAQDPRAVSEQSPG